jgi:murein DD-endopeptidase MepM/ murein hydrolase activator NlpD
MPGVAADGPPLEFRLSTPAVYQGGTVRVTTNLGLGGSVTVLGRTVPFVPAPGGGLTAFVGIGTGDPPGAHTVTAVIERTGVIESASATLYVERTAWTVDYITIPPPQPGDPDPLDPEAIRRESDRLFALYAGLGPRRWREGWLLPLEGPITAYFGEQRSFNGGPVGGHHGGTDIGGPPGSPIVACNDGLVVLSERLIVRGNMVILDHGGGVFSGYAHLESRAVEVGNVVSRGQLLGTEGATGLVTGAHLHWEMAVAGILVDGLRWLDGSQGF